MAFVIDLGTRWRQVSEVNETIYQYSLHIYYIYIYISLFSHATKLMPTNVKFHSSRFLLTFPRPCTN
jgi:hypothetical protein